MTPPPSARLRPLPLGADLPGRVWLTAMPGRFAPLSSFLAEAAEARATDLLCLVAEAEIAQRSPEYANARRRGLPLALRDHPIPDYGLPPDPQAFAALIGAICTDLRQGRRLIVHCAAGIGRTGLVAQHILLALGESAQTAQARVLRAGSHPETPQQQAFCQAPLASPT